MQKIYKVKLLNDGGFDGLDECIGKTFNATKNNLLFKIKTTDLVKGGADSRYIGHVDSEVLSFWADTEAKEIVETEEKFKVGDRVKLVDNISELRGKTNFYGMSNDIFKYMDKTYTISEINFDEDDDSDEINKECGYGTVKFEEDGCCYHFPVPYLQKVKKLAGTILSQKIDGDIMTITIQL